MGVEISEESKSEPLSGAMKVNPLLDIVVAPREAFRSIWERPRWIIPLVVLLICFVGGSILQARALHNVQATAVQQELQVDQPSMSAPQRSAVVERVRTASPFKDAGNWVLAFAFIAAALGLALVVMSLTVMLGGGHLSWARNYSAALYIAFPTLGVYFVVSGLLIALRDPSEFTNYADLGSGFPSVALFAPFVTGTFARGFLESVNPFTAWAGALYFLWFIRAGVGKMGAIVGAAIITLGGAGLQGLIAMLST